MNSSPHHGDLAQVRTPKNLVVFLDGTNNKFDVTNTNVVRLFQASIESSSQMRYYDPGVGTLGHPGVITKAGRGLTKLLGLMFGLGVSQNVLDAYRFLMRNHSEGDKIYLFGFSRGALEARALAALIHRCGILHRELETLDHYALEIAREVEDKVGEPFKKTFAKSSKIRFMGLWDTVTSMGSVWSPIRWPHTTTNPSVEVLRHAIALEERRGFFRQNRWDPEKRFREMQNVEEGWFIGVHCDVGGGYPPNESALWTIPYLWIAEEAAAHGLLVDSSVMDYPVSKARSETGDANGYRSFVHDSMKGLKLIWPLTEFVPRTRSVWVDGAYRRRWLVPAFHWLPGWLMGRKKMGRARTLRAGDWIHSSVIHRYVVDETYRPESLHAIGMTLDDARKFLQTGRAWYVVP